MEIFILVEVILIILLINRFFGKYIITWYNNLEKPKVVQATDKDYIPCYGMVFEYTYEGNGLCKLQSTSKSYNKRATIIIDNILQIELDQDGTNYYYIGTGKQQILNEKGIPYDYRKGRFIGLNKFYTNIVNIEVDKLNT